VWEKVSTDIKNITGVHDIYFVFAGENPDNLFKFDYWHFTEKAGISK